MPQFPAQLQKRCDVCGGIITQVTAMAGVKHVAVAPQIYMCGSCNAVYNQYGDRDLTYPSIYDVAPTPVSFRKFHQQLTAPKPAVPAPSSPEDRLAMVGLTKGEPVQVYTGVLTDWQLASAKDYATGTGELTVTMTNGAQAQYTRRNWRTAMQPLPAQVLAPPMVPVKKPAIKKALTKQVATAPLPPPTPVGFRCWGYDEKGEAIATVIAKTDTTTISVKTGTRKISADVVVFPNPNQRYWHVFEARTGASLGYGDTRTRALDDAMAVLKSMTKAQFKKAMTACARASTGARLVDGQNFFNRSFKG